MLEKDPTKRISAQEAVLVFFNILALAQLLFVKGLYRRRVLYPR